MQQYSATEHNVGEIDTDGDGVPDTEIIVNADGTTSMEKIFMAEERAMLQDITERQRMFHMAADLFTVYDNAINIPTLLLTSVSALISFLSSTPMVADEDKTFYSVLTGVLATAASVLGTMSRQFGFASKKDLFGLTSSHYRICISKIKFRMREMSRTKDLVPNPRTAYAETLKFQLDQGPKQGEDDAAFKARARAEAEEAEAQADKELTLWQKKNSDWWDNMRDEVLDIQKNLQFYPGLRQIEEWKDAGFLSGGKKEQGNEDELPETIKSDQRLLAMLNALGIFKAPDLVYLGDDDIKNMGISTVDARKLEHYRLREAGKAKRMTKQELKSASAMLGLTGGRLASGLSLFANAATGAFRTRQVVPEVPQMTSVVTLAAAAPDPAAASSSSAAAASSSGAAAVTKASQSAAPTLPPPDHTAVTIPGQASAPPPPS